MSIKSDRVVAGSDKLLSNRNFLFSFGGSSLAGFGDSVFEITLVLWIATDLAANRAWSPIAVSGLLAASALPTLIVGPIAGVFVDRWDPRTTIIWSRLSSALLVLCSVAVSEVNIPLIWKLGMIYLNVIVASIVAQFLFPSSARLLQAIVPASDLPRAASWLQGSASLTLLVGPALASALFALMGPMGGLIINAVAFAIGAGAAMLILPSRVATSPAHPLSVGTVLHGLKDGLTFFRSSPTLVSIAVCMTVAVMGASIVASLDVYFVSRNLGAPSALYGLLSTAQGVGMLAGAGLAVALVDRIDVANVMWVSVVAIGVSLIIYARLTAFWPAMAVIALLGVFVSFLPIALNAMVLRETSSQFIGRVVAIFGPLQRLGMIVGLVLGGTLYGFVLPDFHYEVIGVDIGPLDTIFSLAGAICVLAGLYARRNVPLQQSESSKT
jgi:MFS family permease